MKCGTQAALAVGAGYLLGRRRKMKLAIMMAAGAATGGLGKLGGPLLRKGVQMLGSTEALDKVAPQLGDLADAVRGDLIDAGKAAATAAVTNRLESLTDSLHERADLIREPGEAAGKAADAGKGAGKAARSGAGEATRRVRRARPSARDEEPDEPRDEDELGDEDEFRDEDEARDEEFDSEEPDQPADEEPEAEEPRPTPRRRRSTTTRRRSPVVRSGR